MRIQILSEWTLEILIFVIVQQERKYIKSTKGIKVKYSKCSNGNCKHNVEYLCKANGLDEDIVCKQGKVDAIKKANWSTIRAK